MVTLSIKHSLIKRVWINRIRPADFNSKQIRSHLKKQWKNTWKCTKNTRRNPRILLLRKSENPEIVDGTF